METQQQKETTERRDGDMVPSKDKRWGIYSVDDHGWFCGLDTNGDPDFCETEKYARSYANRLHAEVQALLLRYEYSKDAVNSALIKR